MEFIAFTTSLPTAQAFLYLFAFLFLSCMFLIIFWIIVRLLAYPLHWFWGSIRNLMDHA